MSEKDLMSQNQNDPTSPRWSATTKLLVGLVIVSIVAFLLFRFSSLVPPLLMIFIIAYLLHPVTAFIAHSLRVSWKAAVNILYLSILVVLIGLLTWGGVGLVQQIQSLIRQVQFIVANLPAYVADISTQVYQFGPFVLDMQALDLDLNAISQQLLSFIQPLLGQTGNLVGAVASGAATIFGWTFFILVVSYFVMVESSGLREDLLKVEIPGFVEDFRRLGNELSKIWNAFLRGQILIFSLSVVIYSILLPALGVRFALGIALMAGLAKFLPYIGPAITWLVMALVTFFQPVKPFDLQPLTYMLIVVVITFIIDNWIIDSLITPRIMARALKVHPGAILVAALIAANLLGILGVIIAAPFLATITLLGRYTMRKMFDQDPWAKTELPAPPPSIPDLLRNIVQYWKSRLIRPRDEDKPKKEKKNEQQPQRAKNRNNRRDR
jgi:predicted PurR-regulated permease PerM